MKKYTIKELVWTEDAKDFFSSNWFYIQDSFDVWKRSDGDWGCMYRYSGHEGEIKIFPTKEEAFAEANGYYKRIVEKFLEEVED